MTTLDPSVADGAQIVLADRLANVGYMVAGIAHELNNALSVQRLSLAMLRRATAAGASAHPDDIDGLEHSAGTMIESVRQLLLMSRSVPTAAVDSPIQQALEVAVEQVRGTGRLRSVTVNWEFDDPTLLVRWSESNARHLCISLILNAVTATSEVSDPSITIRSWREGDVAFIEFADNGPGFDSELEDPIALFATTRSDGTGMGLWVARYLAEGWKGALELQAGETGAVVRVSVPVC